MDEETPETEEEGDLDEEDPETEEDEYLDEEDSEIDEDYYLDDEDPEIDEDPLTSLLWAFDPNIILSKISLLGGFYYNGHKGENSFIIRGSAQKY